VDVTPPLILQFRAPHLSFPPPGPFCLVCGHRPTYPRRVRFPAAEFNATLCGRHLRRAQMLRGLPFLLAALAVGLACVTIWFPFNLLAVVPAAAALGLRGMARRGGLPCTVEAPDGSTLAFHYASPLTSQPAPESSDYHSYRPPPPPVPFGYVTAKSYSRAEIVGSGKLIAGDRFALLPDRLLSFLEFSEVAIQSRESLLWKPRAGTAVLVPPELHDGSERARRGLALFLRKEQGAFVYAGRAEVSNWPVDGSDCWLQLSLDEPLRSPIPQVAPSVEQALRELAPDADLEARLRWVAAGDDQAWDELSEELQHQGEVSGKLVPLAPLLLSILREGTFAHAADLLWIFALAAKSPAYIRQAASQGVQTYDALLASEDEDLRLPAAFCLQSCAGVADLLRLRTASETHEDVRAAMLAVLGVSRDPSNLPFLLNEIRSGETPLLRAVAALAALEAAPTTPLAEAAQYLQENPWSQFENLWESIDPAGAALLNPEELLARLS